MLNTMHPMHYKPKKDSVVVFNSDNNRFYNLDRIASLVWEIIKQPVTLEEIVDAVMQRYDVAAEYAERDVLHILQEMENEGLLQTETD